LPDHALTNIGRSMLGMMSDFISVSCSVVHSAYNHSYLITVNASGSVATARVWWSCLSHYQ